MLSLVVLHQIKTYTESHGAFWTGKQRFLFGVEFRIILDLAILVAILYMTLHAYSRVHLHTTVLAGDFRVAFPNDAHMMILCHVLFVWPRLDVLQDLIRSLSLVPACDTQQRSN